MKTCFFINSFSKWCPCFLYFIIYSIAVTFIHLSTVAFDVFPNLVWPPGKCYELKTLENSHIWTSDYSAFLTGLLSRPEVSINICSCHQISFGRSELQNSWMLFVIIHSETHLDRSKRQHNRLSLLKWMKIMHQQPYVCFHKGNLTCYRLWIWPPETQWRPLQLRRSPQSTATVPSALIYSRLDGEKERERLDALGYRNTEMATAYRDETRWKNVNTWRGPTQEEEACFKDYL